MPAPASASVDAATIQHRFNHHWCYEQTDFTEEPTDWWYAVSIRVDPNELWADDGEGNLWVVPFETDGADDVTFGEPQRARLVAVPVGASAGAVASATVDRGRQRVLAAALERPDKEAGRASAGAANPGGMPLTVTPAQLRDATPEQREALQQLPDDADQAALDAIFASTEPTEVTEPVTPPVETEPETPTEPPAAAAAADDGTVRVDRATFDQMKASAQRGDDAYKRQQREDRDRYLATAVTKGKFPPSRVEHYAASWDADPEGTKALIDGLAEDLVPLTERGHSIDPAGSSDPLTQVAASADPLPPTVSILTPAERAKAAR